MMHRRGFLGALAALPGLAWLGRTVSPAGRISEGDEAIANLARSCGQAKERERVLRYRKWKRMQFEQQARLGKIALDGIEEDLFACP